MTTLMVPKPPEEEFERPERNKLFRGWCNVCGTPIYPGRFNWYCRICAAYTAGRKGGN